MAGTRQYWTVFGIEVEVSATLSDEVLNVVLAFLQVAEGFSVYTHHF